jgi:putative DNA primase/helicase
MVVQSSRKEIVDAMEKKYKHVMDGTGIPYALQCIIDKAEGIVKTGELQYKACCPCHDDSTPSLSINYDKSHEKVLLYCHACGKEKSYNDFLAAWGIDPAEIEIPDYTSMGEIVATYDWYDTNGEFAFQHVKIMPFDAKGPGDKTFLWRRPNGNNGWIWNLDGMQVVPYHLPELLAADTLQILITEGEKDVETLEEWGYVATTSGGAKTWKPELNKFFHGRDVVIVPDNDDAGKGYADTVASQLWRVAKSIKIINIPFGKDVSEYFEQGGTKAFFDSLMFETLELDESPVTPVDTGEGLIFGTDMYNADRFVTEYKDKFRFNRETKTWLVYDGCRWNPGTGYDIAVECYIQMAQKLLQEVVSCRDSDKQRRMFTAVKYAQSSKGRSGALSFAQSMSPIACDQKDFDQDPYLLNCLDGTVDLRTGELKPHDPNDMISKLAPTNYKYPGRPRKPEQWLACLERWHSGNKETIDYLQRLSGYCLTGLNTSRCFPIFYGNGHNGKNVFLDTLRGILGDYGDTAPETLLVLSKNQGHPTEIAALAGKRFIAASELEGKKKLRTALVKTITGNATTNAHFMHKDGFEFANSAKVILITNHLPIIEDTSNAIWDRLHKLGWEVEIPIEERDGELTEKLKAEWTGILRWAVAGWLKCQEQGGVLKPTKAILAQTEGYRAEQNPVKGFIDAMCEIGDNKAVHGKTLREAFDFWASETQNHDGLSSREFSTAMRAAGYTYGPIRVNNTVSKGWIGLALRSDALTTL